MADREAKSELGGSLMFIGLALWVADLLVVFYLPALTKAGGHALSIGIVTLLAVAGLILMIIGYGLRRKTEAS
jgi:hypothetical protein